MKKAITTGRAWTCENLDLLAPITAEFVVALFDDGTQDVYHGEPMASPDEVRAYVHSTGQVYIGDTVHIVRGRKMIGETKIVKSAYRYNVPGTYGHAWCDYLTFEDGTKVAAKNCDVDGCPVRGMFSGFYVGGRW